MDKIVAGKYETIVSEVILLYKQQLVQLEQSQDAVFRDALQKIVFALEELVADYSGSVPEARALTATHHLSSLQNLPISKNVAPIVNLLIDMQNDLRWRQNPNYNDDLLGKGYMDNYCHSQLVGQEAFYQHPEILLGFYVQGDGLFYPDHNHPAKEVYTVLSGRAKWRQSIKVGGGEWREKESGEFIFHDSLEYHAMDTNIGTNIGTNLDTDRDAEPLIALYAWYGDIQTDATLS